MVSVGAERTILRLRCCDDNCEEIDETTQAEHPPDSLQVAGVKGALEELAAEHERETGHETRLDVEGADAN